MSELINIWRQFESELRRTPIEDGYNHPSQEILMKALQTDYTETHGWLLKLFGDYIAKENKGYAASLIKILGREYEHIHPTMLLIFVQKGLQSEDVELRDNSAGALEHMGQGSYQKEARVILWLYGKEEKVPWLKSYMQQVYEDLAEV